MNPPERMNFKCYSVLKRRFGITILQIREKKSLLESIPHLIEAISLMEVNYTDDIYDRIVIHCLYILLNESISFRSSFY